MLETMAKPTAPGDPIVAHDRANGHAPAAHAAGHAVGHPRSERRTRKREADVTPERDDAEPLAEMIMRMGRLELRLARNEAEVDAAQALRWRVFYEEMGAAPTDAMAARQRDFDDYDAICDHLLVLDHSRSPAVVVGTYRLIRRSAAKAFGRFYSSAEYDISPLLNYPGEILELGRSCVDIDFRFRPTMQLLWRGIAAYINRYDIQLLFGCASLPGTDPEKLARPLSFLYWHHLAPPALRPVALKDQYVDMRLMPNSAVDPRVAMGELPPLIKGYMRVGGFVGDGAVVDHQFNTTDVCIVVKTESMTSKYTKHYERTAREDNTGRGNPPLGDD